MPRKLRHYRLQDLHFVDEKLWRRETLRCAQHDRIWVKKGVIKSKASKAIVTLLLRARTQAGRAGVMTGLMCSLQHGMAEPHFIPPSVKLNSQGYCNILSNVYAPQMAAWTNAEEAAVFVQGNAPSHVSRCTREFMQHTWAGTNTFVLAQPPQSPDLNLLDFAVWCEMGQHIPQDP